MNDQIIHEIKQLMVQYKNQIPNVDNIPWHEWTRTILDHDTPYYQLFKNLLYQLDVKTINKIYTNFIKTPPTIVFKDIADKFIIYYEKLYGFAGKINAGLNTNMIINLLSYALVVEVVVPDYFDRIDERFGWN